MLVSPIARTLTGAGRPALRGAVALATAMVTLNALGGLAWFFREGEASRWAAARFGEFRVTPDGQALLVGLADAALDPIR